MSEGFGRAEGNTLAVVSNHLLLLLADVSKYWLIFAVAIFLCQQLFAVAIG